MGQDRRAGQQRHPGSGPIDGPLSLDLTARESMTSLVVANYVHQVILTQQVIPGMVERGSGRILDMVSGSARIGTPKAPAGAGGWGIAYSASKAAFGRFAGGINAEFGPAVVAFNVDPGNVVTEKRKALHPTDIFASTGYGSQSPKTPGRLWPFSPPALKLRTSSASGSTLQ